MTKRLLRLLVLGPFVAVAVVAFAAVTPIIWVMAWLLDDPYEAGTFREFFGAMIEVAWES